MSKRDERKDAPTVAPAFDVEAYARESERRLQHVSGTATKPAARGADPRVSITIPKASPTGIDFDPEPTLLPSTVPLLVARERVTELLTFPTESFLLGYIDGVRDVRAITEACGLPSDLVKVTLSDLVRSGVVVLRPRAERER